MKLITHTPKSNLLSLSRQLAFNFQPHFDFQFSSLAGESAVKKIKKNKKGEDGADDDSESDQGGEGPGDQVASNMESELEVAIVKATSHDDNPVSEKYIRVILNLTSYSRGYVHACVAVVSKRLEKTCD